MKETIYLHCPHCSRHASECVCIAADTLDGSFTYLENNVEHEITREEAFRLRAKGLDMFADAFNSHSWVTLPPKAFVMKAMQCAPLYFWVVPASSTGKYHTATTQGKFGLVKHTLMVMYWAKELSRTFGLLGPEVDKLYVAAAIHDLCKYGQAYDPRYFGVHECLPAVFLGYKGHNIMKMLPDDTANDIIRAIAHHNGSLATGEWTTFREAPVTTLDQVLHLADYVASRKEIRHAPFEGLVIA